MARYIHSMIRVLDEARSLDFYRRAFGLSVADRLEFDDFTLIYLSGSESRTELELTVNRGRVEPYDLGDGYGHVAFSVADLDAEHARMTEAGFDPGKPVELVRNGRLVARFFFVTDPDGYRIEVLQRDGRFR